jgi:putative spermidine/putrescine transport system substrate-binding protein
MSRFRMNRRRLLRAAAGAGAAAAAPGGRAFRAHAQENLESELVFRTWGGPMSDALMEAWVEPFQEQYGVEVIMDTGELPEVQLQQQAGNPQFDVVLLNRVTVYELQEADVLEPLNTDTIPNLANVYPQLLNEIELSVPGYFGEMGLAYNTDKVTTTPTSWEELWKPDYAGHVVTPTGVDGGQLFIPPIAKLAGTSWDSDLAPLWDKLEALKPNVLTQYTSAGHMLNLLETEDAWIGPWYNGRTWNAIEQGLPLGYVTPVEGATIVLIDVTMPKGAPHPNAARAFVNHALETASQQRFAELFSYAPARRDVTIPEERAQTMPFGEEGINNLIIPDWERYSELQAPWVEEWNKIFGAPAS